MINPLFLASSSSSPSSLLSLTSWFPAFTSSDEWLSFASASSASSFMECSKSPSSLLFSTESESSLYPLSVSVSPLTDSPGSISWLFWSSMSPSLLPLLLLPLLVFTSSLLSSPSLIFFLSLSDFLSTLISSFPGSNLPTSGATAPVLTGAALGFFLKK